MYKGHLTQRTIYLQAGQIRLLLNSLVPSSSQNISLHKFKDVGIKTGTFHYLKPLILLKCKNLYSENTFKFAIPVVFLPPQQFSLTFIGKCKLHK